MDTVRNYVTCEADDCYADHADRDTRVKIDCNEYYSRYWFVGNYIKANYSFQYYN